jgi:glycosyltransferase involved in cell wall biosynthesis
MVVTHIGTVYKTSSPRSYLDALDQLPEAVRNQVETRFVGRTSDSERGFLESRKSAVKVMGFMPQAEALKMMEETDYLVLTMTNEISMPGKVFEYMASGKPILAIAPQGSEVDRLLRETGAGVSAPPNDPVAIEAMLMRAFENWKTGTHLLGEQRESVLHYERPRLVEEYGSIIREAVARQRVTFERR